jgi:hypothetical protein
MSNLVPYQDQEKMASAIAKSGLFGLKDQVQVLALMAVAQAEGRHPATVAKEYHIIQGRPALKADAMLARFQQAGGKVDWTSYTDDKVEAVFTHPQGGSLKLAWTLAQAKAIGLATKDNWKLYPRAMLRARVISEGIRTVYPGVLTGEYTPEEISDFRPDPTPISIKEVIEGEVIQEGSGFPLYTPESDGSVKLYKTCLDVQHWEESYFDMVEKIKASKKFSDEEKATKIQLFTDANKEFVETIILKNGEYTNEENV